MTLSDSGARVARTSLIARVVLVTFRREISPALAPAAAPLIERKDRERESGTGVTTLDATKRTRDRLEADDVCACCWFTRVRWRDLFGRETHTNLNSRLVSVVLGEKTSRRHQLARSVFSLRIDALRVCSAKNPPAKFA